MTIQIDPRGSYTASEDREKISSVSIELDEDNREAVMYIDDFVRTGKFIVRREKDNLKVFAAEESVSLGSVMAVYRNLRENYEYRLRYDEAGKFFIKEMELKRKYREVLPSYGSEAIVKPNCWFRRNLSLTGLYYHLSRYGEDLFRPTLAGILIVLLSTLFWSTQSRPTLEPTLNLTNINPEISNHTSTFILLKNATNYTHLLKAFQRSIADFIPILQLGGDTKIGAIDYVIKIVGGAVTFGLIAIALRRKFERKYTR
jgi:hypothetical protein